MCGQPFGELFLRRRLLFARDGAQLLGCRPDPAVLLEHAWHFLAQRIGHGERFLLPGRRLACRQRREQAQRWQRDLVLPLEVRVEHRREVLRGRANSPGNPRRFQQCLVDLVMFGLQRPRDGDHRLLRGGLRST